MKCSVECLPRFASGNNLRGACGITDRAEFPSGCAHGTRQPHVDYGGFDHSSAKEIAGSLGHDESLDGARFVAHASGEVP